MKEDFKALQRLTQIIAAACAKYPHNREIIEAFRPVMLACRRLAQAPLEGGNVSASLDEESFKAGVPLLRQNDLIKDAPWEELALDLIPKVVEGLPALKDDLQRFAGYIQKHPRTLSEVMLAGADTHAKLIDRLALEAGVGREALLFLSRWVVRIVLERHTHAWAGLLEGFAWEKGYCPICGGSPMLARIEEGIPRRWLYCSRCAHAWQFSRVICPACGNDDQKTMTYYFVEDATQESTFACESCKHYLITVNKLTELADFDADIAGVSLVHLDVLMQEKGYHPVVETGWNILS